MEKNNAAQELGKRGGDTTAARYGKIHFSAAGKKGMAKRWGNVSGKTPGTQRHNVKKAGKQP